MSERRTYPSLKALQEEVHPATVESLRKADREITAEHEKMCATVGWLHTYGAEPEADQDHKRHYQLQAERLARKFDDDPHQVYQILCRYEDLVSKVGEFRDEG